MTTFQILIDAFLKAVTHLTPISRTLPDSVEQGLLHWNMPGPELELLVLLTASVSFLIFFRFDWLGMISAGVTSITQPLSLRQEKRTLDQHTLLFIVIVFIPKLVFRWVLGRQILDSDLLNHSLFVGGLCLITGTGFWFSKKWNRRIHGLNHLKLSHACLLSLVVLFSIHPAFNFIGLLWIGLALCNYHYEAVFKYSMLILGLSLFWHTFSMISSVGIRDALDQIGHLNSVAVLVVSFTVFWIGLENLQKNLSEHSYSNFQWLNWASGIYFMIFHFFRS